MSLTVDNVLALFPVGTDVGAYIDSIVDSGAPRPIGAQLDVATVAEDGSLFFDGLEEDGTTYVLAAELEGHWRLMRAPTMAPVAAGVGEVSSVAGRKGDVTLGVTDIAGLEAQLGEKADKSTSPGKAVVASSGSAYTVTAARTTFLTLTADCALTLPSAVSGDPVVRLVLLQDGTGGHQVFWPGVFWEEDQAPAIAPEPGAITIVELVALGKGQWLGVLVGKGFGIDSFAEIAQRLEGMVFFAMLDEAGVELVDLTGNAPGGTYVGAPVRVAGSLGNSGLEDADSEGHRFVGAKYGTVPHAAPLELDSAFTAFVRIKLIGGLGTSRGFIALGDDGLYIRVNDENEVQLVKQNSGIIAYTGTLPEDDLYHTVIVGRDGEEIVGELDGDDTLGAVEPAIELATTADPMLIGTGEVAGQHGNHDQHLTILWDRLLTDSERKLLHHSATGIEARPTLLYDFEDGTFEGFNFSGVGEGPAYPEISEEIAASGTKAVKVDLEGEQNRAELVLGGSGDDRADGLRFGEGDHYRINSKIYIPVGRMRYGLPGAHNLFCQLKSDGDGSPQASLHLWDYAGQKGLWLSDQWPLAAAPEHVGTHDRWLTALSEGQWHEIGFEFVASEDPELGLVVVYLDGVEVGKTEEFATIVEGRGFLYVKFGLYRNGATIGGLVVDELTGGGPGEIFIDDIEVVPL